LLEQVHKAQTGFLETERLLRKVENEIIKLEELNKRNIYVNTLYEQAHELVRSKNWRKALDKIEEIQKLDDHFVDKDGIFEKVRAELEREEEVVQRQNELAATYAEAVRLLKNDTYQEALDKWQEVKAIDPKYPDRQGVQRTARKKLAEANKIVRTERVTVTQRKIILSALSIFGIIGLIVFLVIEPSFIPSTLGLINPTSTSQPTITPQPTVFTASAEFLIQIHILTSSDWTQLRLKSGGKLKELKKLSSSLAASDATFDSATTFYLNQPIERANGINTVEMVVAATLTNITPGTQLVLEIRRGCIGKTIIELSNAIAEPTLVKTLTWGNTCSSDGENIHEFEIPVELFVE